MRKLHDLIDVPGKIKTETERAFWFTNGVTTAWLPKSQCEWNEDENSMTMPEWLAIEKSLI